MVVAIIGRAINDMILAILMVAISRFVDINHQIVTRHSLMLNMIASSTDTYHGTLTLVGINKLTGMSVVRHVRSSGFVQLRTIPISYAVILFTLKSYNEKFINPYRYIMKTDVMLGSNGAFCDFSKASKASKTSNASKASKLI
jgi:hypothetical protein